jgi:ribosomal protein S18 acetylase RimI-like enzyme
MNELPIIQRYDPAVDDPERIKELLVMATGSSSEHRLHDMLYEFKTGITRRLFTAMQQGNIVGLIGIDPTGHPAGFVTSLAVASDKRKQGIGKLLLQKSAEMLDLKTVELETDEEAVDFYRRCGFTVHEIKSPYPEHQRFSCTINVLELINR